MNFKKQLIVTFSTISFLSLAVGGFVSYRFNSKIVNDLTYKDLSSQLEGAETAIKISAADNKEVLTRQMNYWSKAFGEKITFSPDAQVLEVEDQVTHQKKSLALNAPIFLGKLLSQQPEVLDKASAEAGSAMTVFTLHNEGLVRSVTSLKKADGNRATGTYIPPDSPVYKSIAAGNRYTGRALVLGTWYATAYEPIFQNNKVMGAYFMGFPETTTPKILDYLKNKKILNSGYFYVMDKTGNLILHPTLEGKNLADMQDLDGKFVFKEILEKKDGLIKYPWLDTQTQKRQDKVAIFKFFPELDWTLVASADMYEVEERTHALGWTIFTISLISTLIIILVSAIYGQRVSKYIEGISSGLLQNTGLVQNSIENLAESVDKLSSSTNSSAASLEETAASLEEVSSTIKVNTENSAHAADLSSKAFNAAADGSTQLRSLIDSMKATGNSTKKIEEITTVIDDLAFQTNLLALNAAVEAARAGEQGKGFAVVAEAVRSLAQRSSTAAKDISILIQEVSNTVSKGVQIADKSGETLTLIVQMTEKVAALNQEIATATNEQSKGIHQVNQAVNQLDGDSQSNARVASEVAEDSSGIKLQIAEVESRAKALDIFVNGKS